MAGRIPTSGSISIGDAAGSGRSLNELRNIKRSTTTNSQMAMSTLRDWFRSYVDPTGDASSNFPGAGDEISFSDFRNMVIFGVQMEVANESDTEYDNSANGQLRINGINGTEDYTFRLQGLSDGYDTSLTPTDTADATFTGLGGSAQYSRGFDYTLTCTDDTTGVIFTLTFQIGLGSTSADSTKAKITGTTTSGGNGTVYTFGSQSTSFGDTMVIYIEDPDPSGTSYG